MNERRKFKRRYLLYYVRVYDAKKGLQIGHLVDITPQGAMIISEHPLPTGQTFHLRLELTYDISDRQFMDFTAKSIWSEPDIDPHYYNTGFEIPELDPKDAEIVQKIIEVYSFRDNQAPPAKK